MKAGAKYLQSCLELLCPRLISKTGRIALQTNFKPSLIKESINTNQHSLKKRIEAGTELCQAQVKLLLI